jgi:hypothetical protein
MTFLEFLHSQTLKVISIIDGQKFYLPNFRGKSFYVTDGSIVDFNEFGITRDDDATEVRINPLNLISKKGLLEIIKELQNEEHKLTEINNATLHILNPLFSLETFDYMHLVVCAGIVFDIKPANSHYIDLEGDEKTMVLATRATPINTRAYGVFD